MAETIRLNKVLRELNISIDRAVEFLQSKGIEIEKRPTTKITAEVYEVLSDEFQTDASKKVASKEVSEAKQKEKEALRLERERELEEKLQKDEVVEPEVVKAKTKLSGPKQVGKIELETAKPKKTAKKETKPVEEEKKPIEKKAPEPKKEEKEVEKLEVTEPEEVKVKTQYQKLSGPKATGEKIDLTKFAKPKKKKEEKKQGAAKDSRPEARKKRKRISKVGQPHGGAGKKDFKSRKRRSPIVKEEPSAEEVQKQVRETLEKLQGKANKGKAAKYRREKRDQHRQKTEDEMAALAAESKMLKLTEFVTASEVATMMDIPVTQIISACMSLGMMVTMNQRLDAETLTIVAEEFGYEVEFITADIEEAIEETQDSPEDLKSRAPIVTVMGHVDHGKTSLLDYIREENVIAGESGGITQHIGAYSVTLESGQKIAFLDTPGHEAFTAMRARGAQVTDLAIIVIAADDDIMPQTKEAISHAQAAGVPIVFAINKVDKPTANPDKIKEGLANMNLLVEDWGGKIQSHDISAKTGQGN